MKAGDVMVATVTCHITHIDWDEDVVYVSVYRCKFPPMIGDNGIPQGDKTDIEIAKTLFPVLNAFSEIKTL